MGNLAAAAMCALFVATIRHNVSFMDLPAWASMGAFLGVLFADPVGVVCRRHAWQRTAFRVTIGIAIAALIVVVGQIARLETGDHWVFLFLIPLLILPLFIGRSAGTPVSPRRLQELGGKSSRNSFFLSALG